MVPAISPWCIWMWISFCLLCLALIVILESEDSYCSSVLKNYQWLSLNIDPPPFSLLSLSIIRVIVNLLSSLFLNLYFFSFILCCLLGKSIQSIGFSSTISNLMFSLFTKFLFIIFRSLIILHFYLFLFHWFLLFLIFLLDVIILKIFILSSQSPRQMKLNLLLL